METQLYIPNNTRCEVQPLGKEQESVKLTILLKSLIAAVSLIVIGTVCCAGWFFGVHQPYLAKIKTNQEAERLKIQQQEQRKQQEQQSALLRQQQLQQQQQQVQLGQEQKDQAEQLATAAADKQRADHLLMLRDSDEKAINTYINLVAGGENKYMFDVLTSVARLPLKPINMETVAEPILGDHEKIVKIVQFLSDKLNLNDITMQSSFAAGCIGQSDLWIYRQSFGLRVQLTRCEIFLLRDLDLASGRFITKTDPNFGRQLFFINYKCANNKRRCVSMQTSFPFMANLKNDVTFQCQDEQDARKVGKALAALIYAYGGKRELIDASDSF